MALNLDARQRAMLQDMGITLWVPATPPAVPAAPVAAAVETTATPAPQAPSVVQAAPETAAAAPMAYATPAPATASWAAEDSAQNSAPERSATASAAPDSEAPVAHTDAAEASAAHATPVYRAPAAASAPWFMAPVVHAYTESATGEAPDAGWLVLVECADPADPWAGDAGALLNNMLRALQLQQHPQVRIAPLTRQTSTDAAHAHSDLQPLAPALQAALAEHKAARVLVLGLHAARAVLQRSEALGPLRAELHQLQGVPTVVSYDPAYLLRAPHAKPGAWSDLCRAQALPLPPA